MSRFGPTPEGFTDQKAIWAHMQTAFGLASGKGEYGLANQIETFCSRIKACVQAPTPHRYIKGNDCSAMHEEAA